MKATTTTGRELSLGERKYERYRTWTYLAIAGIACYLAIDVLLAFLYPNYSLIRNAESDYGVGRYSWVMDVNFLLRCAFSLAAVAALARYGGGLKVRFGLVLLTLWAIASGLLAFVPDNPAGPAATASGQNHAAAFSSVS